MKGLGRIEVTESDTGNRFIAPSRLVHSSSLDLNWFYPQTFPTFTIPVLLFSSVSTLKTEAVGSYEMVGIAVTFWTRIQVFA